jgi:tetratricopeptide (TPR) repeat protein
MDKVKLVKWVLLLIVLFSLNGTPLAEEAKLEDVSDPVEKAILYTSYASEKLQQIKSIAPEAKLDSLNELLRDYEDNIAKAMENIGYALRQGKDVSKALEAVEEATNKHIEVLTDLLDKVPEGARGAIRHAIEVSQKGREQALEALRKVQEGKVLKDIPVEINEIGPAGKISIPEDVRKDGGINVPKGVGGFKRGKGRK